MSRSKIVFGILMVMCLAGKAQVNIQFIPEIYGRSMDGLFNCRIINVGGGTQVATLSIVVKERSKGTIVTVKSGRFTVPPGSSMVSAQAIREARIQFGIPGTLMSNRITFPAGSYEYCYTLTPATPGLPVSEQCFDYELAPFAALNLVEPANGEQLCEKRPQLSWQPSVPAIPGMAYQLVLTEIKPGQNATDALNYNLPLINQRGIAATILSYPPASRELEQGKHYAWQVTAYKDETVLNRSEIWSFTVNCTDSVPKTVDVNGYRDIEDLRKGNYYIAKGHVRFALVNPYGEQRLAYGIACLTEPSEKVKRLPKLTLTRGRNKIDLDLSGNPTLKDGYTYVLTIQMPGGGTRDLRFIYRSEDEE